MDEADMVTPDRAALPILDELRTRLAPFCKSRGIIRLELFGSLARGERRPAADVDLLVTFQDDVHPGWDFYEIQRQIEVLLRRKVDLLTRRSVERDENPIRRRSILESTHDIFTA